MTIPVPDPATPMKSLLYWRKSMINGARTVPVIVSMDSSGTFRMVDAAGVSVLSLPVQQASFRFTSMGTMVVTVQGRKYDLLGVGASMSPGPSPEQKAEMKAASDDYKDRTALNRAASAGAAMSPAGGLGGAAGVAGSALMMFSYYEGLEIIKAWQAILPGTGAPVQTSPMKAGLYMILGLAAAIIIGIVIAINVL
ncbi:hypothetical protein [Pseudarthrobacter enclensis]|uniref:Uncharacterized protein n=1 Tax=Pseudarthrobacter enclensis TaxID=993070 RepID=A0ABT9RRE6_9MICC|nr:hypothetical protein [Pseudarthrobacter enclensis]MDP9887810.1 hypothetical protein [Pseudarthrobacter enclensis]